MKINALALKNLNSLRGEFRLDFDAPPLADAGIFAITGPTGAGKTTLLDAICVALYGQTPRLSPGSSAELLTRNTGEGFAEVEFTVEQGRYRSRWTRRRARGRADGTIQPTAMELVALDDTGEERIIEDQVRQVIERVESLTGLDFARFTRSVMLAQGSFASFLKAKDNERAELLERMTGTRLYSFISVQAFNRTREERQKLDEMTAVNAHLDLLPPEQLAELTVRKSTLESTIATDTAALAALRDQAAIAARSQELATVIKDGEQALITVSDEHTAAAASLARLDEAETALPLLADLQAFDALGQRLGRLQSEAAGLSLQRDALAKEAETARQARLDLDQEGACFTKTATLRDEAIRAAELLDQQIRIHAADLGRREQSIALCDTAIAALQQEKRAHDSALAVCLARQQALDAVLIEYAADAGLGHDLSLISGALRDLAGSRQRYAANRREQERLTAQILRQEEGAEALRERLAASAAQIAGTRSRLAQCAAALANALQGQSGEDIERSLTSLRQRIERIEAVLTLDAERKRIGADHTAKKERREKVIQDLAADEVRRPQLAANLDQAEQILSLLEERQRLAAQIANYEADRAHLADGQPCPLCGATNHPWHDGAPVPEENTEPVAAQRRAVSAMIAELATLAGRMQELSGVTASMGQEIAALAEAGEQSQAALAQALAAAELSEAGLALEVKRQCLDAIAAGQDRQSQARTIQAERDGLLQTLMLEEKAESAMVVELETLLALIQEQGAAVRRVQEEERELCQRGGALGIELEKRLAGYGVALPALGQEEATAELLRQRWQRFDQGRQDRGTIETQALEAQRTLAVLATQETGHRSRREQEWSAAQGLAAAIESLTTQRTALLGIDTVEAARCELAQARANHAARIKESDSNINGLVTRIAAITGALTENSQQTARMTDESHALTHTLDERLVSSGFADLSALRRALLPESELQALRTLREGFILRIKSVSERLADARAQLEALGPDAARFDLAALQAAIDHSGEALAAQQRELGALDETIRRQQELTAEHQQRSAQIDCQRQELRHWQLLSDMIGSADGKKFRRFAQGLTLDHLITLANRQLVRLSDRYLLRRHQTEELGLEIIDTYQADAIRPTGTLSGGEEFLVSLALALGLANLSGQTRIDSLFLDEGFGTLDTGTLETALAALAALHESGKTIGVISHVDALKERIPVQIRLRRLAGGCSEVNVSA